MAKKLLRKKRTPTPVVHSDPRTELRRLVDLHRRWTNTAKSWEQSTKDITWRETGEIRPCTLPEGVKADIRAVAKMLNAEAKALESAMMKQLRLCPLHTHFLAKVYGIGPVVASYLIAMIKFDKCPKPSNLIRYCGNACGPDGKREIRKFAPKEIGGEGTFNPELRMRLWQAMTAMYKNWAKDKNVSTRYLKRWAEATYGRRTTGREKGAFNAGRRKATDLLLEDLYVIGRTLEGLPVVPDFYAMRRGFEHGGAPVDLTPRVLTLEEALARIGQFEKVPGSLNFGPTGEAEETCDSASEDETIATSEAAP